jgi:hypothetical protein
MAIGSDSPTFALYDNGEVIYRDASGYKSVNLSAAERDALVNSLEIKSLPRTSSRYVASDATDQPTQRLFLFTNTNPILLSVYGSINQAKVSKEVPTSLLSAYEILLSFRSLRAKSWLPERVEVMIWPYEYAPDKSIIWPKEWPGLDDPQTIKWKDGWSIFIPSSQYQKLLSFLATRREKGAVEIGGKKWAADVRLPFPSEKSWAIHHEIDPE